MDDQQRRPSTTKGKGRHVTTACLGCRRRKIRCDGQTPTCSNCILYDQECIYQHGEDKRKIAPKERLNALSAYCNELERLLVANGIALPPPPPLHITADNLNHPLNQGKLSSAIQDQGSQELFDNYYETYTSQIPSSLSDIAVIRNSLSPQSIGVISSDANTGLVSDENLAFHSDNSPEQIADERGDSETDLLMDQLSGRIGSLQIAEDGRLRFYGATSNLHILHNGPLSLSRSRFRSPNEHGMEILQGGGVGHAVDEELEDHLLKLYFCWEDPSIHVIHEEIFWRERRKCKSAGTFSENYSEVLTNAMCSVGATMTPRQCTGLPEDLPDFFATRSKLLLELEMDAPTLATVQSLVVLSAIEAALTRDARGWLDSGMAVRAAVDLGLHLDPQPYVYAGVITEEQAMLRTVVWSGVFVHDRMWSLYVGRPVGIDDRHITAPFNALKLYHGEAQKFWQPYVDEAEGFDWVRLANPIEDLSISNMTLCAKMTDIRDTMYADGMTNPKGVRQLYDFATRIRIELVEWLHSLPVELSVNEIDTDAFYLPHVIQLHMQYHCVMILANRPFFAPAKRFPGLSMSEIANCRNACTDAAASVARLVHIYRRLYNFRRINVQAVHLIFTATLVHVFNACGGVNQAHNAKAWQDLEICCQALSEMGLAWKNASRALEVVLGIKRDLLKRSGPSKRRKSADLVFDAGEISSIKRRRFTDSEFVPASISTSNGEAAAYNLSPSANYAYNFFDTAIDDFSLASLFWPEYTALGLPHFSAPERDSQNPPS